MRAKWSCPRKSESARKGEAQKNSPGNWFTNSQLVFELHKHESDHNQPTENLENELNSSRKKHQHTWNALEI